MCPVFKTHALTQSTSSSLSQNLTEKLGLLGGNTAYDTCPLVDAGVARLGIAPYMWLVETNTAVASGCLGPGRCATTFASSAMLAAAFNRTAWQAKGAVISTEMRALHNVGGCAGPQAVFGHVGLCAGWS